MSRLDYRGGVAPLRTATELSVLLPVPILMIVEGFARAQFPKTDRSNASPFVRVRIDNPLGTSSIHIHWTQWQAVAVPILQAESTSRWRGRVGTLGQLVTLLNAVVGPGGVTVYPVGTAVGSSPIPTDKVGKGLFSEVTDQYLDAMSGEVLRVALAAGYPLG